MDPSIRDESRGDPVPTRDRRAAVTAATGNRRGDTEFGTVLQAITIGVRIERIRIIFGGCRIAVGQQFITIVNTVIVESASSGLVSPASTTPLPLASS
ncbi:MAG: hypothetical protein R3E95_18660 [Thiolinea sp.]